MPIALASNGHIYHKDINSIVLLNITMQSCIQKHICMYTAFILHVYCMYTACILHVYCMYTVCILYVYCNWFQQSFHCNTPRPSKGGVVIMRVGEKVEDEVEDKVGELGGG